MKNYSFDSIIKEKALGHEAPVPPDAWDNIRNRKKKKRPIIFWWFFALLILAGLGIYGIYESNTKADKQLADAKPISNNNKENGTSADDKNVNTSSTVNTKVETIDSLVNKSADQVDAEKLTTQKSITQTFNENNTQPTSKLKPISSTEKKINKAENKPSSTNNYLVGDRPVNDDINTGDKNVTAGYTNRINKKSNKQSLNRKKKITVENKKATEEDDVWLATKNKMKSGMKTKVAIKAPDMVEDKSDSDEMASSETNNKFTVAIPNNKKDSILTKDSSITKKKLAADTNVIVINKPSTPQKIKKHKLFVDISTTPFVAVQQNPSLVSIKRTTITPLSKAEFTADEISNKVNPSFSYTIAFRKQINKKVSFATGLQYSKLKEDIHLSGTEVNTKYSVVKRLNSTGTALVDDTVATVTNGIRIINATNSYDIVSIPLAVQYNLFENKLWSLSLNGGVYLNIKTIYKNNIQGELIPQYASGSSPRKKNTMATDLFAGIRLARTISKKWQLYAEPTLQFNLMKYNLPEMINYKFIHRAGITIGFSYQLNY